MSMSSKVIKKQARKALNHSQVRKDYPIGHPVLINGTKGFITGYAQAQAPGGAAMCFVKVSFPSEDFITCDPYLINLDPAKESDDEGVSVRWLGEEEKEEGIEEVKAEGEGSSEDAGKVE